MDEDDESDGPDVRIPEDEAELIEMIGGEEMTEQEKNVAIAQAKLIGDL